MLKKIEEAVQPIDLSGINSASSTATPPANLYGNSGSTSAPPNGDAGSPSSTIQPDAKIKVEQAIAECGTLVEALECVGAMYGIPSTNIIADDTATGIKVVDDHIIAPPLPNPKNQTKPIVQAVGSVLDFISQRIDDKLNDFQDNNVFDGSNKDKIANADPAKGKCIGVYDDDDGNTITAYDTGLVDMPNTPAAHAKLDELRANNTIPTFDPSANRPSDIPGMSYFTDEDDITEGVDMMASADKNSEDILPDEGNDVAAQIQESAYHVNLCSKYGNTRHLGYDMLTKHGFDFVKPVDSVIQESNIDKEETVKDKKKKKIKAADIKYMKFDNTNILKAVKLFNSAREDQEDAREMNIEDFMNHPDVKKAVKCLDDQFDCHINLRFIKSNPGKYENCGTNIFSDLKRKMTISKSKGFQLGGLPIDITVYNHYFEHASPKDTELFGQSVVGTICHEIFHNIASVLRQESSTQRMSLMMTLELAAAAPTVKEKRIIITNYVDSLDEMSGNKLLDKMSRKKMIKSLTALCSVSTSKAISSVTDNGSNDNDPDEYVKKLIKQGSKITKKLKGPGIATPTITLMASAAIIVSGILFAPGTALVAAMTGVGATAGAIGLSMFATDLNIRNATKRYESKRLYEEYYCDLFASMYKLPKVFFIGNSSKKITANDINQDTLNEWVEIEREFFKALHASYPSDSERTHAGVTVAKNLLKTKDLDPDTKKYCKWVVDNFSNVHKTNIKTIYNKTTFSPKEAEDLDKHLEDLIRDNNVTLTESFVHWLNNNEEIF